MFRVVMRIIPCHFCGIKGWHRITVNKLNKRIQSVRRKEWIDGYAQERTCYIQKIA